MVPLQVVSFRGAGRQLLLVNWLLAIASCLLCRLCENGYRFSHLCVSKKANKWELYFKRLADQTDPNAQVKLETCDNVCTITFACRKPGSRPGLRRTTEGIPYPGYTWLLTLIQRERNKKERNRDLWTFIIQTACQRASWRHLIKMRMQESRRCRTDRDSERRRSKIVGRPGRVLTSGNLGMWGPRDGSLDDFLLSANTHIY